MPVSPEHPTLLRLDPLGAGGSISPGPHSAHVAADSESEGKMKRAMALLGLALLAAGCGKSGNSTAENAAPAAATGKPADDEAKGCIVAYLGQCGWQDVQLTHMVDQPEVPKAAKVTEEAWAFTFTATYTNVVGERLTSENWVAVVTRSSGKPCVKCCFDEARHLVGGHSGEEIVSDQPAIVAPKP